MTPTYKVLASFLPKGLSYVVLYGWYTLLCFLIMVYAFVPPAEFIYWGH